MSSFLYSSFAYNGTDLLKELVGDSPAPSETRVLYRWVLKSSEQYTLLQQAIDQWYINNKKLLIRLKSEFTNNSLRSFVSLYAGIRLPIVGTDPVDEATREQAIKLIRAGTPKNKNTLPTTTEAIQNELIKLLQNNRYSDQKRINQLLELLQDPYANSYTGQDSQHFEQSLNGEFVGIGVVLEKQSDGSIKLWHIYDGPAKWAGLQKGDTLIRVDNTIITTTTSLTEVVELIQWKIGSKVIIVVLRNNKIYEYSIIRRKIIIDPIITESINPTTTLMKISMFQTNIYESFKKYLPVLTQSNNLIIDLRNNLWWDLYNTEQILHHFIPQGQPLYHIDINGILDTTYSQWKTPSINNQKSIYLLTNNNTASASEIFAWVVHDYFPNSTIIGTPTYGKWTIQTVWTNERNETIKFTTGKRLLGKNKNSIDQVWLQPDIILSDNIQTPQDELLQYVINQL